MRFIGVAAIDFWAIASTTRNYPGADNSYKDVREYLKKNNLY